MKESEMQNAAVQCNTRLKGGNLKKCQWSRIATFTYAFLCIYLQKLKIKNSRKCYTYRSLL